MVQRFHESEFDTGTQIKLAIFRGYIREWIPVFLKQRKTGHVQDSVNFFDFFAGSGTDVEGNPGSALILRDELKLFCDTQSNTNAGRTGITLYFNDKDETCVSRLKKHLDENDCSKGCCKRFYSSLPFDQAFSKALAVMQQRGNANLVIMDQFGFKEVTPDVINRLAQCGTTDILFYITSSNIRRFASVPAIQKYCQVSESELASSDHKSIHRYICDYFRSRLQDGTDFHLAPFSIKKGSNIYGVIFGSGSLRGLAKFLKVAWSLDPKTGEANYNIDRDPAYEGGAFLFPGMEIHSKMDNFFHEIEHFIQGKAEFTNAPLPVNNASLYRFTLERGFLPKHAGVHLRALQKEGRLEVFDLQSRKSARKGAFYLSWNEYCADTVHAVFQLKG